MGFLAGSFAAASETGHFMQLSVIIPTRNRARSLTALLDSLDDVVCPDHVTLELIVVNNGSTDSTAKTLAGRAASGAHRALTVINQEQPGKSRALNCALSLARGDVVLVLDDDVKVDANCIAKHIEAHERLGFAAIQGRILPGKDPKGQGIDPSRVREYNIPIRDFGPELREIRGVIGTNVSFSREVLERVGLFDVRLGPGASGYSEDSEFSIRLRRAGFKIGYTPHAVAYHELNPARYGRSYHRDAQFRKGVSRSIYRRDSILFKALPNILAHCLRWGWYRLIGDSQKLYKTEGRLWKCLGYLAGKYQRGTGARADIPK